MNAVLDFFMANSLYIILGVVLVILTLIGFLVDRREKQAKQYEIDRLKLDLVKAQRANEVGIQNETIEAGLENTANAEGETMGSAPTAEEEVGVEPVPEPNSNEETNEMTISQDITVENTDEAPSQEEATEMGEQPVSSDTTTVSEQEMEKAPLDSSLPLESTVPDTETIEAPLETTVSDTENVEAPLESVSPEMPEVEEKNEFSEEVQVEEPNATSEEGIETPLSEGLPTLEQTTNNYEMISEEPKPEIQPREDYYYDRS